MPDAYLSSLPKKRMAAGALFFDDAKSILVVKPTYRSEWSIPGGVVEANESPGAACLREVQEEVGLKIVLGPLLCLDYQPAITDRTESLQFIFWGGVLSREQIASIHCAVNEIATYRFVNHEQAVSMLSVRLARRVTLALQALDEHRMIYAEAGTAIA